MLGEVGRPASTSAASAARSPSGGRAADRRCDFLGGMGTAAGVTNFCGLHGNVYGERRRLVQGMASATCWRGSTGSAD